MSSIFTAVKPTEENVFEASKLSKAIYKLHEQRCVAGYRNIYHHVEADNFRIANWCLFTKDNSKEIFVVFRGSQSVMDWLVNLSCVPDDHPNYVDVNIHSGYYAEVKKEYKELKVQLKKLFLTINLDQIERFVVTGHSKGGALAQLLTDLIYNDKVFQNDYPSLCSKLVCLTFSAPMVFWFLNNDSLAVIGSASLFHNYIVRSDPVPLFQAVLSANKYSIDDMVRREAEKKSVFGQALVSALGVEEKLKDIQRHIKGFKPVGSLYVAHITKIGDPFGVDFEPITSDLSKLNDWEEVREEKFDFRFHGIDNHVGVAQNCYEEYLDSLKTAKPVEELKPYGLYVENSTAEDLLFMMSWESEMYWKRVPKRKTVHVGTNIFWYSVEASKYDQDNEPRESLLFVKGQTPTERFWNPFMLTLAEGGRLDNVSTAWSNGRTVVVKKDVSKYAVSLKTPLTSFRFQDFTMMLRRFFH